MSLPSGRDLVLASTSRYRRELLARLVTGFRVLSPDVDEQPEDAEAPVELALRLAHAKARAVTTRCPDALVIGSDQVADLAGNALGKPGNRANALAQLAASAGRVVRFHTAVCVIDARSRTEASAIDLTEVQFRPLADDEIARYVDTEQPFDCAGSFKAEGFGISLFERIRSEDPTALIGLPLIALARLLREAGLRLP